MLLLPALLLGAGSAAAHGTSVPLQPAALWWAWSVDPVVIVPLLVAHWCYGRGVLRLWARAGRRWRGLGRPQVLSFLLGEAALGVALVSPLDQLGGTLLSAHMAQHGLLVAVAPPLLVAGQPGVAFAWAMPAGWSRGTLASLVWRPLARFGRRLSRPLPAAALHGAALWVWHAPGLFDDAVGNAWLHALEHACFLGTALLFWWAVLGAHSSRRAASTLGAAFFTLVHTGLLGALMTLSPRLLYTAYGDRSELWALSPLEDQQLAGLLMWVPMGVVYFGACLLLASRLVIPEERHLRGPSQGGPASPRGAR